MRLGYRVRPELSLGPEISLFGYRDFDAINTRTVYPFTTRLGAFARYDNGTHEVSLSGGRLQPEGGEGSTYFSGQWLRRF